MRIVILGYGRMGHEIEQAAETLGHTVILRIDRENSFDFTAESVLNADVALEFMGPDSAEEYILKALSFGLPVVSGSTGWLDSYNNVADLCRDRGGSFIHSSNFSVGVNILYKLNADLARIMSTIGQYKVTIEETHHIRKLDSPSGTAITLAEEISKQHSDYDGWKKAEEAVGGSHIPVASVREGTVPGIHSVLWESAVDIITLKHEAKNRKGFALGAILAAEYIYNRKGVFSMSDVLNL